MTAWTRRTNRHAQLVLGLALLLLALGGSQATRAAASATLTGVDLSTYVRVGRFDLPEPTRTQAPPGSVLAQEASAVTYDRDTGTLFVVGDGSTSIVQVTKTGQLVDSMTIADFEDTEGLAYVGGGKFVLTEERLRQANLLTYAAGTTLHRADVQTVKLGTTTGNTGIEGITNDPQTSGFVVVKESDPLGIFQTGIDFAAGTATNGSPTTENSTNLFDPALAGVLDFADVFALSNLATLTGPDSSHLLVLSQESARVVEVDRSGAVSGGLTIVSDPGNPLSIQDQQHEGLTMDEDGNLYVVSENGGGDIAHPQLWVYAPSTVANQPPTAIALTNQVSSIAENTSTATRIKVANVSITDDGLGANALSVSGPDAGSFEVDSTGLYIKVGTVLDFETKASYSVTVDVDDVTVGATPDASAPFTLNVTDVADETPVTPPVIVSEVSPWSSGNAPYAADWIELTNTGSTAVSLAGWKIDDDSNSFGSGIALNGVASLGPGASAVFIEGTTSTADAFKAAWFGTDVPAGFAIGTYSGGGIGLGTGGDAVNVFDALGNRVTGVRFGASTTGFTFDNTAGAGSTTLPLPLISTLSSAGINGAFLAADGAETGSPGTTRQAVFVTEVSPWSSGDAPYGADWFELTNTGRTTLSIAGWKMDDNSNASSSAVALNGVASLGPGRSAVFIEGTSTTADAFKAAWFGGDPPTGFQIGSYSGSGVGLGTGGDAVNVFDALGNRVTGVSFRSSTTGFTFENAVGIGSTTLPLPEISKLSVAGVSGAFVAADGIETGSPLPAADTTPPTVVATGAPVPNANGWNNTDVTVSYTCTDDSSGVNPATSSLADDVLTESGTASATCVDRAGNSASASYAAEIDKGAPTVGYDGNAGSYGVLDTVAITCAAADALSGVATSTCADANGPAWTFGAGAHTLGADVADEAGNTGSATTTFTVAVRPADLCTLTRQFVQGSAKYRALRPLQKVVVDVLVSVACDVVLDVGPRVSPAQKARFVASYKQAVQSLVSPGWLTSEQAAALRGLADAL